jgi:hypothetical protein
MKIFILFPILLLCFGFTSFKNPPAKISPGIYSLNQNSSNESIEYIEINDDFTFKYFNKNSQTKGTYSLESGNLILESSEQLPISKTWKIDANEKCIKSRRGLAFIRICNC